MKNKFIFSFKSIVIFAFSFVLLGSLVLSLSLPQKVSGLDVSEPVGGWDSLDNGGDNEGGGAAGTSISNNAPDEDAEAMPTDIQIGQTWTGPSGQTYIATAPNPTTVAILEASGTTPPATLLVPVENDGGNGDGDGDKYSCSGAPNWTCSEKSNGTYSSLSACQSNCKTTPTVDPSQAQYRCKQCHGTTCSVRYSATPCASTCTTDVNCVSPAPTTKYSCNTSTWSCFVNPNSIYTLAECRIVCQPGGSLHCPGNDYCYACNKTTYRCYHLNSGTYSTLSGCQSHCKEPSTYPTSPPPTSPPPTSPPPTCKILEFSINGKTNEDQNPLIVWVKASLTGYFSVNDTCKTCRVSSSDTWGYPPQTYEITTLESDYTETFKINTSGTYSYILECTGTDPEDIAIDALSLQVVKAENLPWWREIIPNLGGFLRGL